MKRFYIIIFSATMLVFLSSCASVMGSGKKGDSGLNIITSYMNWGDATRDEIESSLSSGDISVLLTGDYVNVISIGNESSFPKKFTDKDFNCQKILLMPGEYEVQFAISSIKLINIENRGNNKYLTWKQNIKIEPGKTYFPKIDYSKIKIENNAIIDGNIATLKEVLDGQIYLGDVDYKTSVKEIIKPVFSEDRDIYYGIQSGELKEFSFHQRKELKAISLKNNKFVSFVLDEPHKRIIAIDDEGSLYSIDLDVWTVSETDIKDSDIIKILQSKDYIILISSRGEYVVINKSDLRIRSRSTIDSNSLISVSVKENSLVSVSGNTGTMINLNNKKQYSFDLSIKSQFQDKKNLFGTENSEQKNLLNESVSNITLSPDGSVLAYSPKFKDKEYCPIALYFFNEGKKVFLSDIIMDYYPESEVYFLQFSNDSNYIYACMKVLSDPYFVIYYLSDNGELDLNRSVFAGPSGVSFYHKLLSDNRYRMAFDIASSGDSRNILVHGLIHWGADNIFHTQNFFYIPTRDDILNDVVGDLVK